jgi:hypothetical protein
MSDAAMISKNGVISFIRSPHEDCALRSTRVSIRAHSQSRKSLIGGGGVIFASLQSTEAEAEDGCEAQSPG